MIFYMRKKQILQIDCPETPSFSQLEMASAGDKNSVAGFRIYMCVFIYMYI